MSEGATSRDVPLERSHKFSMDKTLAFRFLLEIQAIEMGDGEIFLPIKFLPFSSTSKKQVISCSQRMCRSYRLFLFEPRDK